jgi:hypothetical protein
MYGTPITAEKPRALLTGDAVRASGDREKEKVMRLTELVEAIDTLRQAGWKVESPVRKTVAATYTPKRIGRPPKVKRGRPRKAA